LFDFAFAQTPLPEGLPRWLLRMGLRHVDRFVAFSNLDRQLFAEAFDLPIERFDVLARAAPTLPMCDGRVESGDYVCAVGGNARDYATLLQATELTPEIPLVIVARPENLAGMHIPDRVRVHVNIEAAKANNIFAHARFIVLPRAGNAVACGHVTMLAAMYVGRPFITTRASNSPDDRVDGDNGIARRGVDRDVAGRPMDRDAAGHAVDPEPAGRAFDPEALAHVMRTLWNDPARVERLAEEARAFAQRNRSERAAIEHVRRALERCGALQATIAGGPSPHHDAEISISR
jgi:glycosyltransferase involved in cell wall biosynthesis